MNETAPTSEPSQTWQERTRRRHLRFGWWTLAVFVVMGIVLEGLHGFKVAAVLDVGNETRRLLLRLAHAHGALLALVNVVFGAAVHHLAPQQIVERASFCFIGSTVLVPLGFLLGGLGARGGDPGVLGALVPPGALLLLAAVVSTARGVE